MSWFTSLLVVLQILAALVMIGLILIQHGKGADMGASFGSGASGSLFGATGSANFLSRSTAVCATLFFICTLLITYFATHTNATVNEGTILDRPKAAASQPAAAASTAATPAASGAAAIPK